VADIFARQVDAYPDVDFTTEVYPALERPSYGSDEWTRAQKQRLGKAATYLAGTPAGKGARWAGNWALAVLSWPADALEEHGVGSVAKAGRLMGLWDLAMDDQAQRKFRYHNAYLFRAGAGMAHASFNAYRAGEVIRGSKGMVIPDPRRVAERFDDGLAWAERNPETVDSLWKLGLDPVNFATPALKYLKGHAVAHDLKFVSAAVKELQAAPKSKHVELLAKLPGAHIDEHTLAIAREAPPDFAALQLHGLGFRPADSKLGLVHRAVSTFERNRPAFLRPAGDVFAPELRTYGLRNLEVKAAEAENWTRARKAALAEMGGKFTDQDMGRVSEILLEVGRPESLSSADVPAWVERNAASLRVQGKLSRDITPEDIRKAGIFAKYQKMGHKAGTPYDTRFLVQPKLDPIPDKLADSPYDLLGGGVEKAKPGQASATRAGWREMRKTEREAFADAEKGLDALANAVTREQRKTSVEGLLSQLDDLEAALMPEGHRVREALKPLFAADAEIQAAMKKAFKESKGLDPKPLLGEVRARYEKAVMAVDALDISPELKAAARAAVEDSADKAYLKYAQQLQSGGAGAGHVPGLVRDAFMQSYYGAVNGLPREYFTRNGLNQRLIQGATELRQDVHNFRATDFGVKDAGGIGLKVYDGAMNALRAGQLVFTPSWYVQNFVDSAVLKNLVQTGSLDAALTRAPMRFRMNGQPMEFTGKLAKDLMQGLPEAGGVRQLGDAVENFARHKLGQHIYLEEFQRLMRAPGAKTLQAEETAYRMAQKAVTETHFDYDKLSGAEMVMKRVYLYPKFHLENQAFWFKKALEHPTEAYAVHKMDQYYKDNVSTDRFGTLSVAGVQLDPVKWMSWRRAHDAWLGDERGIVLRDDGPYAAMLRAAKLAGGTPLPFLDFGARRLAGDPATDKGLAPFMAESIPANNILRAVARDLSKRDDPMRLDTRGWRERDLGENLYGAPEDVLWQRPEDDDFRGWQVRREMAARQYEGLPADPAAAAAEVDAFNLKAQALGFGLGLWPRPDTPGHRAVNEAVKAYTKDYQRGIDAALDAGNEERARALYQERDLFYEANPEIRKLVPRNPDQTDAELRLIHELRSTEDNGVERALEKLQQMPEDGRTGALLRMPAELYAKVVARLPDVKLRNPFVSEAHAGEFAPGTGPRAGEKEQGPLDARDYRIADAPQFILLPGSKKMVTPEEQASLRPGADRSVAAAAVLRNERLQQKVKQLEADPVGIKVRQALSEDKELDAFMRLNADSGSGGAYVYRRLLNMKDDPYGTSEKSPSYERNRKRISESIVASANSAPGLADVKRIKHLADRAGDSPAAAEAFKAELARWDPAIVRDARLDDLSDGPYAQALARDVSRALNIEIDKRQRGYGKRSTTPEEEMVQRLEEFSRHDQARMGETIDFANRRIAGGELRKEFWSELRESNPKLYQDAGMHDLYHEMQGVAQSVALPDHDGNFVGIDMTAVNRYVQSGRTDVLRAVASGYGVGYNSAVATGLRSVLGESKPETLVRMAQENMDVRSGLHRSELIEALSMTPPTEPVQVPVDDGGPRPPLNPVQAVSAVGELTRALTPRQMPRPAAESLGDAPLRPITFAESMPSFLQPEPGRAIPMRRFSGLGTAVGQTMRDYAANSAWRDSVGLPRLPMESFVYKNAFVYNPRAATGARGAGGIRQQVAAGSGGLSVNPAQLGSALVGMYNVANMLGFNDASEDTGFNRAMTGLSASLSTYSALTALTTAFAPAATAAAGAAAAGAAGAGASAGAAALIAADFGVAAAGTAAVGTAAAGGAAAAGAGGVAASGGLMAGLAAIGPVGWAVGGLALAAGVYAGMGGFGGGRRSGPSAEQMRTLEAQRAYYTEQRAYYERLQRQMDARSVGERERALVERFRQAPARQAVASTQLAAFRSRPSYGSRLGLIDQVEREVNLKPRY
jgi:hypothetical protein